MRFFATTLVFCGVVASSAQLASAQAQAPVVPHKIHFAGMTLTIRDDAREEIQKDVNMLTQSPKYFEVKAERARTYFPIIQRIFAEERVPDDFKFLVLQESALIADAVSVSDAVGFWQFKDFTAREMGLRVDGQVDERMNIVSSTRAAAKYIKQNNFMFNNWVYALQSYQMGAGGVRRTVGDEVNGVRHMEINRDTYWYVKKFLAHKVAFEAAVASEPKLKVSELVLDKPVSLSELSTNLSVEAAGLKEFNKWLRAESLPGDKAYTVIVPSGTVSADFSTLYVASNKATGGATSSPATAVAEKEILINEIPVIQAKAGETLSALATRAGLDLGHFMKYNDLEDSHRVNPGGYYFTAKKKSKTEADYHKVKSGENLWQISQLYGVQVKRLKKYNRISDDGNLTAGTMIWLNSTKPKEDRTVTTPSSDDDMVAELNEDRVFDWATTTITNDQVAIQSDKSDTHTVQTGETLFAIAKQHELTVADLRRLNNLAENVDLKPGQVLKVTVNETVDTQALPSPDLVHEVKVSDTLYSVARQYGVTIKDLMECNNKKDFSLSPGERLKIPSRQ